MTPPPVLARDALMGVAGFLACWRVDASSVIVAS
jgi:hypothetical protein